MTEKPKLFARYGSAVLAVLALAGITLWLFWPAAHFDLLNFDDDRYITNNPHVAQGLSVESIRWAFTSVYENYWIPILWISYMLDSTIFGTGPFGYHATNVFLHAINAGILFLLLKTETRRFWLSAFVAALFAWHPLRVESVAWITERKDVLSALFLFLCLFAYARATKTRSFTWKALSVLFMALGLMAKPILVTVPFLLLLLDIWPLGRWKNNDGTDHIPTGVAMWRRIREKAPFWLLMLIFAGITYYTQATGNAIHGADTFSLDKRLAGIPIAYGFYLQKTLAPLHLSALYGELPLSALSIAGSALILAAITYMAFRFGSRTRAVPIGWTTFLLLLAPVIGLVRVGTVHIADRFTYLPSIGLGISIAWFCADALPQRKGHRVLFTVFAVMILLACAYQTRNVLPHWKDSLAVFGNAIKFLPDNAVVNNNYGTALLAENRVEEALKYYEKAVLLDPHATSFKANTAIALVLLGRAKETVQTMENAMQGEHRRDPFLAHGLATAHIALNQFDRAIPLLESATTSPQRQPAWSVQLAATYLMADRMNEANRILARLAQDGWPDLGSLNGVNAFYMGLWYRGHVRPAWQYFERMTTIHSNNAFILNNAAWLLATAPPPDVPTTEAIRLAKRGAALLGDTLPPNIMDTLSVAYAANGDFTNALIWVNKAIALSRIQNRADLTADLEKRRQAFEASRPWTKIIGTD